MARALQIVRKYYLALPFRIARNASRACDRPAQGVDAPSRLSGAGDIEK